MPPKVKDIHNAPEVALKDIRENPAALRNVDKTTEEYESLVDSVRNHGILNPVVVRKVQDPETKEYYFGLVDGLHRYSAAQDAGLQSIPVRIIEADEIQALETQIITNVQKIETKPAQYTTALKRLMALNPLMTVPELAKKLSKSFTWLNARMSLSNLVPPIAKLVDEGQIGLSNAYALAVLPPEEQPNFLDRALTMKPHEFAPTVQLRAKEIKDAKRQGRQANPIEFQPVAYLQKISDLKSEIEKPQVAPYLRKELAPAASKDWEDGFKMGLSWSLHIDPKSVEVQKQKDDARKAEKAAANEAKKAERDAKRKAEKDSALQQTQADLERLQATPVVAAS